MQNQGMFAFLLRFLWKHHRASLVTVVVTAIVVVVVTTYPLITVYRYESSDRNMAEIEVPEKGRTLRVVQRQFEDYKRWTGNNSVCLMRTSKPNWANPWLWHDNLSNPRWKIPYMEPSPKPKWDYSDKMREDFAKGVQANGCKSDRSLH